MLLNKLWGSTLLLSGRVAAVLGTVLLAAGPDTCEARVLHLYPSGSFESAVEGLSAADTLIIHQGTYAGTGRVSITVLGSSSSPVLVEGAPGETLPLITRPSGSTPQNTINIEGASYVTIRGLEITGNGDAVTMAGSGTHHITIEECHIHHVDVGINFRATMDHIVIRKNHIHDTGQGGSTGEAMYVGCNYAACVVSDCLIENNWIHNTFAASQGDGIEIKPGSHSNVVRDNVIYDTNYPCVLVYGTDGQPRNTIERNVMWNCGDSGIQAAADAVIRNNIILESPSNGFNSQDHQGETPNNLEFTHNTLIGGNPCLRLSNWAYKQGMVLANNAIYCQSGSYAISDLSGVTVTGNVVYPSTSALPPQGYSLGQDPARDLLDYLGRNVYPAADSRLRGAGDPRYVASEDFNGTPRQAVADAGAYAWTASVNPGWRVVEGFKQMGVGADSIPPDPPQALRPR